MLDERLLTERRTDLGLSPRETEVLELVSLGMTNVEVAARLRVTTHAVKFHLAAIYRKLGVANRTEAASTYLRRPTRWVDGEVLA